MDLTHWMHRAAKVLEEILMGTDLPMAMNIKLEPAPMIPQVFWNYRCAHWLVDKSNCTLWADPAAVIQSSLARISPKKPRNSSGMFTLHPAEDSSTIAFL